MKKSIGVVVATYNGEKYITKQLESILQQTVQPDLIVVTDGRSSDKTVSLCNEVLGNNSVEYRMLCSNARLSVKENFEKGLLACDTDYMFFADQDDVWSDKKIEITIKAMKKNNAALAFCNACIVDEELRLTGGKSLWQRTGFFSHKSIYKICDKDFVEELLRHNVITGMCCCITRELKDRVLPLSENTIHDGWIGLVASLTGVIVPVKQELVLYRQHGANTIGVKSSIIKKFSKGSGYIGNVEKRKNVIQDLLERVKIPKSNEIARIIYTYLKFMEERVKFLHREKGFLFPLRYFKEYRKYEVNFWQIIVKDYYARIFYKQ